MMKHKVHLLLAAMLVAGGMALSALAEEGVIYVPEDYEVIADAVAAAKNGYTIKVAAGTYAGTGAVIDKRLTIIGAGRDTTFIDGGSTNRAFVISKNISGVEISGFTFNNCKTPDDGNGGAILAQGGTDNYVVDCTFNKCSAKSNGAMLYSATAHGLAAVRCYFFGPYGGDGVTYRTDLFFCFQMERRDGGVAVGGPAIVANCTFIGNVFHDYCLKQVQIYNSFMGGYAYKFCGDGTEEVKNTVYSSSVKPTNVDSASIKITNPYNFINPIKHDFRIVAGSKMIDAGDPQYLEQIPEQYRYTDIKGESLKGLEKFHVGAIAVGNVYEPKCGAIGFVLKGTYKNAVGSVDVEGEEYAFSGDCTYQQSPVYFFPEGDWPQFLTFSFSFDNVDFKVWGAESSIVHYPDNKGLFTLMPRPYSASSLGFDLMPRNVDRELYVDADVSSDNPDGSIDKPFKTIQEAVDAAPVVDNAKPEEWTNTIIHVAAGTYATGGRALTADGVMNRVCITNRHIRLIGAGADKTFIIGAADPSAAMDKYGCGDNAVRCYAANGYGSIEGFTLTGGHTMNNSEAAKGYGGAVYGNGVSVLDSVISNNVAYSASTVYGNGSSYKSRVNVIRSKVINNLTLIDVFWARNVVSASSLWAYNHASTAVTSRDSIVFGSDGYDFYDSTWYAIADTVNFQGYVTGWSNDYPVRNSIVVGSGRFGNVNANGCLIGHDIPQVTGSKVGKTTWSPSLTGTYVKNNNYKFADADPDAVDGDFRLLSGSSAIGLAFYDSTDSYAPNLYTYATKSLDGIWPDFTANGGKFNAGAYRKIAPTMYAEGGGMKSEPDCSKEVLIYGGEKFTFTATKSTRPFYGFLVITADGTNTITATNFTYTVPADPVSVVVKAWYDNNWWVDAKNGNDENFGNQQNPFKTLKKACSVADSELKDVIHVMPGVYNEGQCSHANCYLYSRADVPANVSLIAEGTPEETIVVGAPAPGYNIEGCGTNATRCVYANKSSLVRGFTLTGGYGYILGDGLSGSPNGQGGGVYSASTDVVIEDCIISNNIARICGGGVRAIFRRCLFADNRWQGSGGHSSTLKYAYAYNCIFEGNMSSVMTDMYAVDSCTIGTNNGSGVVLSYSSSLPIINTLVMQGKIEFNDSKVHGFSNCVFQTDVTIGGSKKYVPIFEFTDCVTNALPEDLDLADRYVPTIGSSILVDSGCTELYDAAKGGELDICRNRRIANGNRIDIGAVEADWRELYAKKLGARVKVTDAYSAVELVDDGVLVPAGNQLSATVGMGGRILDKRYIINADAAGKCKVIKDGSEAEFSPFSGEISQKITATNDFTELVFESNEDGSTLLKRIKPSGGGQVIIR